jgi:hypothetical protein
VKLFVLPSDGSLRWDTGTEASDNGTERRPLDQRQRAGGHGLVAHSGRRSHRNLRRKPIRPQLPDRGACPGPGLPEHPHHGVDPELRPDLSRLGDGVHGRLSARRAASLARLGLVEGISPCQPQRCLPTCLATGIGANKQR